ncbi:YggS family pyridoxal phosphate-dependent enzyme [Neobacillus notoginsengisoli]|uniref:Pyridoxal phosphate homeostasis protein n=1 Tax=Neobacillus notoginsengisoli TaxID=1578198 RepID=A0A417YQX2_9BACI|nr:YggS family pyridoxal phosphate-dependent enzyme [Neobacillus notoginsengisoli]RHW36484.1 YggS family pyridoxal phosphate-dependent enzyme [Neobacillus notoginsengisoli]
MGIAGNLKEINKEIHHACLKTNRDPADVKIIAVTKYVSKERAAEAIEAGITHIGENRDDGFLEKWEALNGRAAFHFIGTLQTRKVRNIIDKVDYIHSLDRLSLAKEINKRANAPVKCLVQVNVSGEDSKHGISASDTFEFIEKLADFKNIRVEGLMTMAPLTDDEEVLRACFRNLRVLRDRIQEMGLAHSPCQELSMGMSNDYTIAVEEGATMIRIGTALVGEK